MAVFLTRSQIDIPLNPIQRIYSRLDIWLLNNKSLRSNKEDYILSKDQSSYIWK